MLAAGVTVLGVVLLVLWIGATRRHVRRRGRQAGEWEAADRLRLWTSGARCPTCGSHGGILRDDGVTLWFTCLSCRSAHRRAERG